MIQGAPVNVLDYGADPTGTADSTAAIQAAHNASYNVHYPNGTYKVTNSITLRTGTFISGSGAGQTIISLSNDLANATSAIYELIVTDFVVEQGGITVKDIFLNGNSNTAHGFYLQNVRYPVFENVWILNFDGSAIVYDYCEEGYADFLNINGCGRTSGNANVTANTLYGQITFDKTASALGNNNFLRFNDCVIANGNCSGEILTKGGTPSRIYFNNIQSELSGGAAFNRDWLAAGSLGGIYFISGCDVDQYRNVLQDIQFCEIYANNIRANSSNFYVGSNGTGSLKLTNSSVPAIDTTSISGGLYISNSVVSFVYLNYIAGIVEVTNISCGDFTVSQVGATPKFILSNSKINGNLKFISPAKELLPALIDNVVIAGSLEIYTVGANIIGTVTTGTVTVDPDNYYQPTQYRAIKILSGSAAPTTDYWKIGSIVYNTAPSAGGNIGWVCVGEGTPGIWKTFGTIAS